MPSEEFSTRLAGVWGSLVALYPRGAAMSSSSSGREREQFVAEFLYKVLPPAYRIGSGDVIDSFGRKTGQQAVVVEFSFLPTLPAIAGKERLYLAEGVAALVEVKSNLAKEWEDVKRKASVIKSLRRHFRVPGFTPYGPPPEQIPYFAVGYTGWKTIESVQEKCHEAAIDAILIIDQGLFATRSDFFPDQRYTPDGNYNIRGFSAREERALWGLVCCLHYATVSMVWNSFSPLQYALDGGAGQPAHQS
jgi:hypothetical protein